MSYKLQFLLDEAPRLRKISLRHRGFARIPPEILAMTYLTELDLAHNHLTGGCVLQRVAACCSVLQRVVSAIMYIPEVDLMHIHLNRVVNCVGRVAHVVRGVQILFSSLV